MIAFLFVALLAGGFLWRLSKRGASQAVLALMPLALLFFTVPMSAAVLQLVRGFQRIGEQGLGGSGAVAPLADGIWNAVWLGAIGFAIAIGIAAVLQLSAAEDSDDPPVDGRSARPRRRDWMPVGSSILIVPVGLYVVRTRNIPAAVLSIGQALERGQQVSPAQLSAVSRTIARDSMTAILVGGILSAVLVAAAAVNLVAVRRQKRESSQV